MKIEHVALNVEKPSEMVAWYGKHLGTRVIRENKAAHEMHFIVDEGGRVVIEVYHNPEAPVPDYGTMDALVFHIAFAVDDMEAASQQLLDAGATAASEINTTPAGDQLRFMRDPWGVPLQLVRRATPLM